MAVIAVATIVAIAIARPGIFGSASESTSSTAANGFRGWSPGAVNFNAVSAVDASPSPTPSASVTPSTSVPASASVPASQSQTGSNSPTTSTIPSASPSSAPADSNAEYRKTQFMPTPFPRTYVSKLAQAARQLHIPVPDVFKSRRVYRGQADKGYDPVCPPYDQDANGNRHHKLPLPPVINNNSASSPLGDHGDPLVAITLDDIQHLTVGLLIVTHDAPATFQSTIANWVETGLLDLVDDKVAVLSASQPEEIELALRHGFRVYTPDPAETSLVKARHMDWLAQWGEEAIGKFPHARNIEKVPGARPRWATYVAPAQALAYLDMSVDISLFCEKDYQIPTSTPKDVFIRDLLASVALLSANTAAVRLRRLDDANREALPNCCIGECGGGFSDFSVRCEYAAHLDWLTIFCDPQGVEARSRGAVRKCLVDDEGKHTPPLTVYCFSTDSSNWSNNVHMVRRQWWLDGLGHAAVLSGPDNGEFEVNAILTCDYTRRHGLGTGANSERAPHICQLAPGTFHHVELDGWTKNRRLL